MKLTFIDLDALCKRKKLNDRRIEAPLAQLAMMFYNAHRQEKAPAKPFEDFMFTKMPGTHITGNRQTDDQMKAIAMMATKALNGEIN